MGDRTNGIEAATILTFDDEFDVSAFMPAPRTAKSAKIDRQFAAQAQRIDWTAAKVKRGQRAMAELDVADNAAFMWASRQIDDRIAREPNERVRELAMQRANKVVFNDLNAGLTTLTRGGKAELYRIVREAIDEPRDEPTVIEVQPAKPGLLKRLLG